MTGRIRKAAAAYFCYTAGQRRDVRIDLLLLLMEQEATVGSLAEQLGMTQSAVSHQLNLLKMCKLVKRRRDGKMIFYTLVDDHVRLVMKKGMEHILDR